MLKFFVSAMSTSSQQSDSLFKSKWPFVYLSLAITLAALVQAFFMDPVIAADGVTYERSAMVAWLRTSSISPSTRLPLVHTRLVSNVAIRGFAQMVLEKEQASNVRLSET